MRHLIFSDIHSNLEALDAVIEDAANKDVGSTVCLGDFVGYGANPDECVQKVAEIANLKAVLGNHDAAVIDPAQREFFNPVAHAGIVFSESKIAEKSLSYLRSLPFMVNSDSDFVAVHASPFRPESWIYILEPLEAVDAFFVMTRPVAFIGHTHFPVVHTESGAISPFVPGERVKIEPEARKIINVGSVGQPRDGDPRAAYVIFDDETRTAEIHRVEYDVDKAGEKIIEAGLPPLLAHRIRRGY